MNTDTVREMKEFVGMIRVRRFRKEENAFKFRTDETGNRNQKAIKSTAMIVSINLDLNKMIAIKKVFESSWLYEA